MSQLNQLLTSGSDVQTPPSNYLAMFFAPGNVIGFKDDNGNLIFPTASITAVSAALAQDAKNVDITDNPSYGGVTYYPTFVGHTSGYTNVLVDSSTFTYNPNTNVLNTTASYASQSLSSSYATTASYAPNSLSGSYAVSASYAISASHADDSDRAISASYAATSSFVLNAVSASYAATASYLNTLNQDLTFNGNLTLNGTASIAYLNVSYESASVIYSSGSNQLGDASNDVQTLWGTVDIKSGPVLISGSIIANNGFTGSISGSTAIFNQITASNLSVTSTGSINRLQVTTDAILRNGTANIVVGNRGNDNSLVFGNGALPNLQSGFNFNTSIGNSTLATLGEGSGNTALGTGAGQNLRTGSNNTVVGYVAAGNLTSGSNNTLIGSGITMATGSNNTVIGRSISLASNTDSNIVLGDGNGNIRARYSGSWVLATGVTSPSFTGSFSGSFSSFGPNFSVVFNSGSALTSSDAFEFISTSSSLQLALATASGQYSIAGGSQTKAVGQSSFAMGASNTAFGANSTALGGGTYAGSSAFAAGVNAAASGSNSFAVGDGTTATGNASFVHGGATSASALYSHAEGYFTVASGRWAHAEGRETVAFGTGSHAEGLQTTALADYSHTEGLGTTAVGPYQHIVGQYNVGVSGSGVFVVGNGPNSSTRRNLLVASGSDVQITGLLGVNGNATITSNASNTTALTLQGSGSFSGGNQFDFIKAQNTNVGVPTPSKFFRVNNSGSFDIVNSAYDSVIFNLTDSGSLTVNNITASIFSSSNAQFTRLTASNALLSNVVINNNTTFTSNTLGEAALYVRGSGSTNIGSKNFDAFILENSNIGVPTPLKYIRLNPSGALEILSSAKDQIFTLTDTGSLSISSNFTASNIWANSNGTGKNIAIGDDVWFGDINISNTTQLSGQQDPTQAYLKFASGSGTPTLWTTGSNTLNLSGSFTVNPSGGIELRVTNTGVTIGNSLADTHRITGSFLVTGSTHVYGDIKVGNVTDVSSGENTLSVYPPAQGGTGEGGQILLAAVGGIYTSASMIDTYQNKFRILKGTNTGGSTTNYFDLDLNTGGIQATSITSSFSGTLNGATIDSGSWIAYTPTWTATSNPAIGNGTIEGYYKVIGKTCFVRGNVQMGSTTTFGSGEWLIGLPFSAKSADGIQMTVSILDSGTAWYNAILNGARAGLTDKSAIQYQTTGGTAGSVSPTTPITWTTGDRFTFNGSYEIA